MTPHGSYSTYSNGHCRCVECRAAWSAYFTDYRRRLRERLAEDPSAAEHGNVSTYRNWGCRCEDCRAAKSVDDRRRSVEVRGA